MTPAIVITPTRLFVVDKYRSAFYRFSPLEQLTGRVLVLQVAPSAEPIRRVLVTANSAYVHAMSPAIYVCVKGGGIELVLVEPIEGDNGREVALVGIEERPIGAL